jgi:hypothetical protein
MQSIRLLVNVFFGTVILCGALLMIGCNSSSSGGNSSLKCTYTNVPSSTQCNNISLGNSCQSPFTYDSNSKTCNINDCSNCAQY